MACAVDSLNPQPLPPSPTDFGGGFDASYYPNPSDAGVTSQAPDSSKNDDAAPPENQSDAAPMDAGADSGDSGPDSGDAPDAGHS